MTLTQRIRALLGGTDPAADRVRIVDAMRRQEQTSRMQLASASAELYMLRHRRAWLDRRECELINRVAMLERATKQES